MPSIRTALSLLLLATLPAACGNGGPDGGASMAQRVAREFRKDCESAGAPNPAMRQHLQRLCACSEAKIAATPMRFGESEDSINAKVGAATKACYAQLGGAPGEERR